MPSLRPFQVKLKADVYDAWSNGAVNVMPVAATGSGKTVVLADIMQEEPGSSIAIAHRQELVSQISIALARNGVRHRLVGGNNRIVSALQISELGRSYLDPNARTGVGGVDTIVRMNDPWFKQVRLMVQDEGHHILKANKWGKAAALFPNSRGLFPTATPMRADGRGLGRHADGIVDAMVLAPTMRDIINMGYLTDYRIFAPPSDLDLTNVTVSDVTGDFNKDQVRKAVHKSHIVGDVVGHYLKIARGKLGVTFSVDVESATEQAAVFRANGIPAEVVSAKTPDTLRAQILRRFKNREILQLVNVDLFGEGFDLPAIEVVSMARPTHSYGLYVQQFGRALRPMEGKLYAIIIDHVGNVQRHGLPDKYREWTLDRRDRRSSKQSDAIPIRVCTECYQPYERIHRACPHCGSYPPPTERSAPHYVDGDLLELDFNTLMAMRGEIDSIYQSPKVPYGASDVVIGAIRKRHRERQQSQVSLRNSIAWWAGLQESLGLTESQSYRSFYFKFGVDVAGCQTLGAREADELTMRINYELAKLGIDGTVNAEVFLGAL